MKKDNLKKYNERQQIEFEINKCKKKSKIFLILAILFCLFGFSIYIFSIIYESNTENYKVSNILDSVALFLFIPCIVFIVLYYYNLYNEKKYIETKKSYDRRISKNKFSKDK